MMPVLGLVQANAWTYESVRCHMTCWNDPLHSSQARGGASEAKLPALRNWGSPRISWFGSRQPGVESYVASQRVAVRRWARDHADFVAAFESREGKSWRATDP